jgi:hypothetical protein
LFVRSDLQKTKCLRMFLLSSVVRVLQIVKPDLFFFGAIFGRKA